MKHFFLVIIFIISYGFASSQEQKLPSVKFGISAGPSYQLLKINPDLQPVVSEYAKDLNSGFHFVGDFFYFPHDKFGLGFKTSLFSSKGELNDYYKDNLGDFIKRTDKTNIWFVGVLVSRRLINEDFKSSLFFNGGVGALSYVSSISGGQYSETFSKISPSISAELAYDFKLSNHFQLGFSCSLLIGYFEYVQIENFEVMSEITEKHSISRIDFSVGLRFVN